MQRVAVFTIYTGMNAGDKDAEDSIFWLKAYGEIRRFTCPGRHSREHYHPIVHPRKFDGILPVLWHDEDDTIFGVPQRSRSLAHVIPREAVVVRQPIHGLDTESGAGLCGGSRRRGSSTGGSDVAFAIARGDPDIDESRTGDIGAGDLYGGMARECGRARRAGSWRPAGADCH
jgi:hypothetical protein